VSCECSTAVQQRRDWLVREQVVRERDMRVPVAVVRGRYEDLTDDELQELIVDFKHERCRRKGEEFERLCREDPAEVGEFPGPVR
jgi:predicted GNAT family acetyltransferase